MMSFRTICLLGVCLLATSICVSASFSPESLSAAGGMPRITVAGMFSSPFVRSSKEASVQQEQVQSERHTRTLAAAGDITVTKYDNEQCTGSAVATQSLTPDTCVASTIKAAGGAQDVNYLKAWATAAGVIYVYGYTDAACANLVRTQVQPSGNCKFGAKGVTTVYPSAGTPPALPTIAQGFAIGTECDDIACSKNCSTSSFKATVCFTTLSHDTGITTSQKVFSDGTRLYSTSFSDQACATPFATLSAPLDTCNDFPYISFSVAATTPATPPSIGSVATHKTNCTDSACAVGCRELAVKVGFCLVNPSIPHAAAVAQYCSSEGGSVSTVFKDAACTSPLYAAIGRPEICSNGAKVVCPASSSPFVAIFHYDLNVRL
jgi:hypothetical protein